MYYKAQTYSKEFRKSELKYIQNQFEIAELLDKINAPYFKHHYKGKPTKKALSYINKLEKLSGKDFSGLKS